MVTVSDPPEKFSTQSNLSGRIWLYIGDESTTHKSLRGALARREFERFAAEATAVYCALGTCPRTTFTSPEPESDSPELTVPVALRVRVTLSANLRDAPFASEKPLRPDGSVTTVEVDDELSPCPRLIELTGPLAAVIFTVTEADVPT
jgi:hypothetical protein